MIHQVLTNEKYIGNNVYNRISFKLKKKRVRNPPAMWVRCDAASRLWSTGLISSLRERSFSERHRRISDAGPARTVTRPREHHGRLSGILIDETEGMPSSSAYRSRFGSLLRAYQLVAYTPERDVAFSRSIAGCASSIPASSRRSFASLESAAARWCATRRLTCS